MRTRRTSSAKLALVAGAAALLMGGQAASVSAAPAATAVGELQANVSISPGIPPAKDLACKPVTFSFSGGGQVASAPVGDVGWYVGPIDFSGSGSSPCSDVFRDTFAPLSLTVGPNSNFTGSVYCASLSGSLVRIGPVLLIVVGGTCMLNGTAYNSAFVSEGVLRPVTGDGVTTAITSAVYNGAFELAA